jgi:hypothetical protein
MLRSQRALGPQIGTSTGTLANVTRYSHIWVTALSHPYYNGLHLISLILVTSKICDLLCLVSLIAVILASQNDCLQWLKHISLTARSRLRVDWLSFMLSMKMSLNAVMYHWLYHYAYFMLLTIYSHRSALKDWVVALCLVIICMNETTARSER